ncbi:MAG: AAA family ATPase [Desulfobacteraceae bacterium]|nr:AAA family ATPase [Desulfobacteraceae bacterium]
MSCVIAMAGKGGVGKTTVSALVVRYLTKNLNDPVLAIDADPNSNLGILNRFADELESNYKYLLVDNEAGMEHLSRRTSGKVDMLLMVTDYALRGLRAVGRINDMLADLKLDVRQKGLVVNRAPETLSQAFLDEVEQIGVPLLCTIPQDDNLLEFDMERRSMLELPDDSPAVLAVDSLMEKVIQKVVA